MIRIVRQRIPRGATILQRNRLAAASTAFYAGHALDLTGYNSPPIRTALYAQQNRRCAYCERPIGLEGTPIEHFRPKAYAQRGEMRDPERYWWLTWDWDNLFLVCATCNSRGRKGNRFDLLPGTLPAAAPTRGNVVPISPTTFSVRAEHSLFIDPCAHLPHTHFDWQPVEKGIAPSLWTWSIVGRTSEGTYCVERFDLTGVAEVATGQWRSMERDLRALGAFDLTRTVAGPDWDQLCVELLDRAHMFRGARFAMLTWCLQNLQALRGLLPPEPPQSP